MAVTNSKAWRVNDVALASRAINSQFRFATRLRLALNKSDC